ncbi:MAG: hypothetical protein P8O05_03035, partial [Flavobacteriales bacterium]|nr:hypothetical protein [Flavobacteriales bacterium]
MKNLCKICPLFVAVFVVLSGYGQWSTNEEAVDLELFNTLSVDMVGNQIKLGSICGTNPDNLQPQVFGSSILTNEWSALSSFDSFISGSTNYSYVRNVHFLDEETGFASCSNEGGHSGGDHDQCSIIKTTDGGITWDVKLQAPTQHAFEMIEAIEFFDEDNGIAVGVFDNNGDWFDRSAWVAVTTDGGDSWTEVDLPESMYLKGAFGISIYDESSAYMVLNDMDMDLSNAEKEFYIYKTNNMGLTWQEVHSESLPEDFINDTWEYADHYVSDISFANENVGWLIFRSSYLDSYIYRTEDGGESWNEIDHPIKRSANRQPVNFRDIYIVDEDEIFIAGGNYCTSSEYGDDVSACFRGHTLIYTNDGGVSWDIILYDETDQAAFHEVDYNPE